MGFGGGPQGSSGTGGGPTANVFTPPSQPQEAVRFRDILNQMIQAGPGPAGQYYPVAQNIFNQDFLHNPFMGEAMAGARDVANLGVPAGKSLVGAGNQLLSLGFDPQQALFNQTSNQLLNQQNAINAMSGTAGTPYGAGVTGNTMSNFDLNWQNNLLNRATQGAQGAASAFGAGLPMISGSAALPYQTKQGFGQADLGAMGNVINIGMERYALPQQTLNDLESYLQLGQSASNISGQLGNLGFNQGMQSAMGLGNLGILGNSILGNPIGGAFQGLTGGGLSGLGGSFMAPGSADALAGGFPGAMSVVDAGGGSIAPAAGLGLLGS